MNETNAFAINTAQVSYDYFRPPSLLAYKFTGFTGVLAFLTNVFTLTVLISSKELRNSSALLIALIAGHALNGAVHSMVGLWPHFYEGTFVTSRYCVFAGWPVLFAAVYQLLPVLLALNAIERLLAITVPVWYHKKCTPRRLWFVAAIVAGLGLLLILANGVKGWLNDGPAISGACMPHEVFGAQYMVLGVHTMAIVGGVLSTACTSVGMFYGRRRIANMPTNNTGELGKAKRQLRLTQCLLMICMIDMICVVMPNVVLELYNTGQIRFPVRHLIYIIIIYCSDSIWNITAFLVYNKEFRKAAGNILS